MTPGSDKMSSWAWLAFTLYFLLEALPMKPVRSLVSRDFEAEQILRRGSGKPTEHLQLTTLAAL